MAHPRHWLKVKPEGLYCVPGDFYIDPLMPVTNAVITHGHGDHALYGHEKVLATKETLMIMETRYGFNYANQTQVAKYNLSTRVNNVIVTFHPAGHILGSAQIKLSYEGATAIFSGDYKRQMDPTCESFSVQNCDLFITEATFALPVFIHPSINEELNKLLNSLSLYPHRCHLLSAYVLGKCQRIIKTLRQMGYERPIYLHGAMQKMCQLYETCGIELGPLNFVSQVDASTLGGEIVICPPNALHDRWSRKLPSPLFCHASGWMKVRARAKQRKVELPLTISDHADWNELLKTIEEVNAPEIWITHGNEEALMYYAITHGFKAKALSILHYEDESED